MSDRKHIQIPVPNRGDYDYYAAQTKRGINKFRSWAAKALEPKTAETKESK